MDLNWVCIVLIVYLVMQIIISQSYLRNALYYCGRVLSIKLRVIFYFHYLYVNFNNIYFNVLISDCLRLLILHVQYKEQLLCQTP